MRIRSAKWKIEENMNGTYNLLCFKKVVLRDSSKDDVKRWLKREMVRGETVALIEQDGYATDISRRLSLL